MSYCPEHGGEMVCRNPDDYDGLVYDCPEGHTMIYSDGAYRDSSHLDYLWTIPQRFVALAERPEEDGLTKGDDASTHPTQGTQDVMVVRGSQLVAKEYAQVSICLCCQENGCANCWPRYDHTQEIAHTSDS